jgi:hypothetical protein
MPETSPEEIARRIFEDYRFTLVNRPERRFFRRCFGQKNQFWITDLAGKDIPASFDEPFLLWVQAFGELITPEGIEVQSLRSFFVEYIPPY